MATGGRFTISERLALLEVRMTSLEDVNKDEAAKTRRRINWAMGIVTAFAGAAASGITAGLVHH